MRAWLGIIEIKENELKRIDEMIRMVEAETVRLKNENARVAEEKLAEDRLRAEECERRKCEALERTIAETEELRENRSEDPRSVGELEKAIKRIIDRRKSIEADTARILRDKDIIAEKKLAEDKLRAEECYQGSARCSREK